MVMDMDRHTSANTVELVAIYRKIRLSIFCILVMNTGRHKRAIAVEVVVI